MTDHPVAARRWFHRLAVVTIMAATLTGGLAAAPATAATPPGGRANYTVALMRDVGTQSFVRLAQYSLRADGTARSDFWAWNAQTLQPRASTGYTTNGCGVNCTVWTTNGFQNAPTTAFGTWSVSGNDLNITWTSGHIGTERFKISNQATVTRLDLASHPTATDGFGWGSTISFTTGVSVSTIYQAHGTYAGPAIVNNYGTPDTFTETLKIHRPDAAWPVRHCNANCINLSTTSSGVPSNKAYLAGPNAGRKMYFNQEKYTVDGSACIGGSSSVGAGHLRPSLQIIDDNGVFRGLVSVEASLYDHAYGANILGIFDLNNL